MRAMRPQSPSSRKSTNPALNDKVFAPQRVVRLEPGSTTAAPAGDQPYVETWRSQMTIDGVVVKSAGLLAIVLATGVAGWRSVESSELGVQIPGWLMIAVLAGFGVAVLTIFKPHLARITAPVYAVIEGLVLGAISAIYNAQFAGIVVQAVALTAAVFAIMLGLYASRVVRVTDKLRRGVIAATGAVMVVYLVSIVLRFFGIDVPMIHESGPVGILFSLAVVGIAAFNLMLDFDMIEKGVTNGAPKAMEWYAAFSLLVTLVWLYLELLRLLSKLRSR